MQLCRHTGGGGRRETVIQHLGLFRLSGLGAALSVGSGSWYFATDEYQDIPSLIAAKGIDFERLATHTFALEQAETAFRMFDNRETEKAVFIR